MNLRQAYPGKRQSLICLCALAVWLAVTVLFIGMRGEHIFLAILIAVLFFVSAPSRRLVVALVPFIIFGISYDWMNLCPNYTVNPVDIEGLYNAEKSAFGITVASGETLTPNEFFARHTSAVLDLLCGFFYLCWVPLPIIFGLWLYFKGRSEPYLHFALVFLLANFIGFTLYYIHPAAPPWYVQQHGFEFIPGTHGEVAGLGAFDNLTGLKIFDGLYSRNANVFAALPSLHSAYTFIAFIYALRSRSGWAWCSVLGLVTAGIWFTAVYTSHHYLIDVLGGIGCALLSFVLFEYVLMKISGVKRFISRYAEYISWRKA